jgi:hypothetical protein
MKQADKDFILSLFSKKDEYFAALCIKYLEGVEKVIGEMDLVKLVESSDSLDKFLEFQERENEDLDYFKDKDPKYLKMALFPNLNKISIRINFQEKNSLEALGYSPKEIENIRAKVREYQAKKRADKEKLK